MKGYRKLKEYIWLVNTLRRARSLSFAEIQEKWKDSDLSEGNTLARSTFNRHREAIRELFSVCIDCERSGNRYYISNEQVLSQRCMQSWLLSSLTVGELMADSLSLQNRIVFESIPSEQVFLKPLAKAMKLNVKVVVDYRRYGAEQITHSEFEPYCVKLFQQRWYVLGHFHREATDEKPERDYFAVFSLDRILKLELTHATFKMPDNFVADDFFKECFGVIVGDETPCERVVLRAFSPEHYYLADLPLHPSQRTVAQGDGFADFELTLRPTVDFRNYVMSRGRYIKVLAPQWLAEHMEDRHRRAAEIYSKE